MHSTLVWMWKRMCGTRCALSHRGCIFGNTNSEFFSAVRYSATFTNARRQWQRATRYISIQLLSILRKTGCECVCVQYLQINSNSDSVRVIVIKRSHKFRRNEHNGGLWGTISGRHVRQTKRNENEPNENDD